MAAETDLVSSVITICEWCGQEIVDADQPCPALDDGRCSP